MKSRSKSHRFLERRPIHLPAGVNRPAASRRNERAAPLVPPFQQLDIRNSDYRRTAKAAGRFWRGSTFGVASTAGQRNRPLACKRSQLCFGPAETRWPPFML
ncbi:hypothetical protein [Mucilaginibacter sp. 22184]|uniref:hypothetical protein n=1 Tax=Mucilaginibacter sp. 22184 TaxID=3453887 RepID=UPI003F834318